MSVAQERLWFLDQLMAGSAFLNISTAISVNTFLDSAVLKRCLDEIVQRHEILRTTFSATDGVPRQIIEPSREICLEVVDLTRMPAEERQAEATRLAGEEVRRPFDLSRGPLIRTKLLQTGQAEYIFLLVMHHIVADDWSMGVFWRELTKLYEAFVMHRPSPLEDLPIQYADYAVWQCKRLQGEVFEDQLAYWKGQLANLPETQLPTDRPRPQAQTFRGAYHPLELAPSLTVALRELSRRQGATLFMTLLAAFNVLLHRYTGQEDIVVGTYIAGRYRAEIEGLIGFFINTLVLRNDLSGNPSFQELLARVRGVTLAAYGHQEMSFARLVEELQPERDLSRNPLFQVALQLINTPTSREETEQATESGLAVEGQTSVFDLVLHFFEGPERLGALFEYNTDLFDASTISRMADHLQRLLEAIVAEPDRRLAEISFLSDGERHELLVDWNATRKRLPDDESLVSLFEAQVERTPDARAFACQGRQLTYQQLNRRANRLARHLRSLGVGPEVLVGAYLDRSLDLAVALLAILKARGVYVSLDPDYPRERVAQMLGDSRAPVIVTRQDLAASLPSHDAQVVCLDAESEFLARQSEENPLGAVDAENLAYVIYTSGSTGRPKGVAVPHRQVLNRLAWMWETHPFEAGEVACQKTSLNFVDSVWELLGPLLRGVPTVVLPDETVRDPRLLVEALAEHRVTRLWVVPSLLRVLLEVYPDLQSRLPALNFWASGGEALAPELLERFRECLPRSVLYDLYGLSEVWDVTCYDTRREPHGLARTSIGRPIQNVEAYVLDAYRRPSPVGVPGELHVGGAGLARGYLHNPSLTAEKFVPHPFSDEPGARLYETGDRARFRLDGNLEYLGRLDQQVKIRGFRVELGEIEAVLDACPGVRSSVAVAREEESGECRLVAYLVPDHEAAPAPTELRGLLRQRLPGFMVPSALVMLDELPLTPSGKLDRRALPDLDSARPEIEEAYVGPRTPVEEVLVGLWEALLGIERVGIHDDFFELGGHSLLATRLVSRIRDHLQVEIPLMALFEAPTVAGLSSTMLRDPSGRARIEKTARLVLKLIRLPDEEVEAMLAERENACERPARGREHRDAATDGRHLGDAESEKP